MSDHLSDEERARVGLIADAITELVAKRYGLEPNEVVEAVKWVQQHKEFVSRMKHASWVSLFGIMVSALLLATWEGAKALVHKGTN